ncbi:hypothetical protein [Bradyrhizobium quebecense]|uniref:Transglutaminase-like domain-containing protein n=2 Tax=Bradyrhizobium quebecense TaxID=2748629 RepID=A0ABS3MTA0_9BRAD|nr:hypothetical protein [Bradyrhizobium quebecense]UGY02530.1 hypothetical protein J4P68_0036525 [Bradyrhizobium quebecense]
MKARRKREKTPLAKKAAARVSAPAPIIAPARAFVLRTAKAEFALLEAALNDPSLAQSAMEWAYVVRSRKRWATKSSVGEAHAEKAVKLLEEFGVNHEALGELARSDVIEVAIKWFGEESVGWPLRVLPWEHVIASATRQFGRSRDLTILRQLNKGPAPAGPRQIRKVLFVSSQPDQLQGIYDFTSERQFVREFLKVQENNWKEIDSPTEDQLRNAVTTFRPDVIHISGFDTHHARAELYRRRQHEAAISLENDLAGHPDAISQRYRQQQDYAAGESPADRKGARDALKDGFVLARGGGGLDPVGADELGRMLVVPGHQVQLVSFNIANSSARIASMVVAHGAAASIGFQDYFDDDLAEVFYSTLYSRLGGPASSLSDAFQYAWQRVRAAPGSRLGTGIVLWSERPLVVPAQARVTSAPATGDFLAPGDVPTADINKHVIVKVKAFEDLNYSLLHNQRALFEQFILSCPSGKQIRNVRVRVSLYAGADSGTFDRTLDLEHPATDLKRDIHVPLTSAITRSVHESVRTSLFVEVTWGAHTLYRNTMRVRLTPVDQWRDNRIDRLWLPSFVFPRDPAIARLVDSAQRYVRVLRDDPTAGFDGYQSFDAKSQDSEGVDQQVQGLWSAILHELRPGYINPPPGYSNELDSQRLRTPSMVVKYGSGTCIDLALFFAACLELIDIYPVIFLLEGHAFPGYWRAQEYHDEFTEARPKGIQNIVRADSQATAVFDAQLEAWYSGRPTYREIVQCVNAGKLVPLETVRLTENAGFAEAIEAGCENLAAEDEFEGLVDIALAREQQVTPLPILGEEE